MCTHITLPRQLEIFAKNQKLEAIVYYALTKGAFLVDKQQPGLTMMYSGVAVAFGWLLFVALWLFYYASSYSIVQNIGVAVLSLVVFLIIESLLWVPWAIKHAD